jgi:hypothetical protein
MRQRALLVCLLLAGCERKAPGPADCVALADLTLGPTVSSAATARRADWPTAPRAAHDELVRQCLTTPFDYAMLACVERSGALRACYHRLELRRRESQ